MHAVPAANDLHVANLDVVADLEKDCVVRGVNDGDVAEREAAAINKSNGMRSAHFLLAGRIETLLPSITPVPVIVTSSRLCPAARGSHNSPPGRLRHRSERNASRRRAADHTIESPGAGEVVEANHGRVESLGKASGIVGEGLAKFGGGLQLVKKSAQGFETKFALI